MPCCNYRRFFLTYTARSCSFWRPLLASFPMSHCLQQPLTFPTATSCDARLILRPWKRLVCRLRNIQVQRPSSEQSQIFSISWPVWMAAAAQMSASAMSAFNDVQAAFEALYVRCLVHAAYWRSIRKGRDGREGEGKTKRKHNGFFVTVPRSLFLCLSVFFFFSFSSSPFLCLSLSLVVSLLSI